MTALPHSSLGTKLNLRLTAVSTWLSFWKSVCLWQQKSQLQVTAANADFPKEQDDGQDWAWKKNKPSFKQACLHVSTSTAMKNKGVTFRFTLNPLSSLAALIFVAKSHRTNCNCIWKGRTQQKIYIVRNRLSLCFPVSGIWPRVIPPVGQVVFLAWISWQDCPRILAKKNTFHVWCILFFA